MHSRRICITCVIAMALLITYHKVTQIVALCSLPDRYFKLHSSCLPNGLVSFLPLGTIHRSMEVAAVILVQQTNTYFQKVELPSFPSGVAKTQVFHMVQQRDNIG